MSNRVVFESKRPKYVLQEAPSKFSGSPFSNWQDMLGYEDETAAIRNAKNLALTYPSNQYRVIETGVEERDKS